MPTQTAIDDSRPIQTVKSDPETQCLQCGVMVTTGRLYCSTRCANKYRMERFTKTRQAQAIWDKHLDRIEMLKKQIRYEWLDLRKELHREGLGQYL